MRADLEVLGVGEHPDAALQQVPLVSPGVGSLELSLNIRKRLQENLLIYFYILLILQTSRSIGQFYIGCTDSRRLQQYSSAQGWAGLDRDAEN